MRRRVGMCVPMIALLLALAACGGSGAGGSRAEQLAQDIRGEYLAMTACSAGLDVTADYGTRVYEYGIDLSWARDGETVLTLTAPETVAGLSARLSGGSSALEYDGVRVETGPLDESGLSPVDAVPVLLDCAQAGFLAECGLETVDGTEVLRVVSRDPEGTAGTGREISLWFAPDSHALLRGEIAQDGFTIIQCVVHGFTMTAE